jgi:hypothetical protein
MNELCVLILVAISLTSACVTANTQQSNMLPTNANSRIPLPVPEITPTPNAEDIKKTVKNAIDVFGIRNTQEMTLDKQPAQIIASLSQEGDSYDPKNLTKWAEKIHVLIGERDLNNDEIPERFVTALTDRNGDKAALNAYFFWLNNGEWKWLTEQISIDKWNGIEFIQTGIKGEFDIMQFKDNLTSVDPDKYDKVIGETLIDFRVKKGKYELYKCREVKKGIEKVVPCEDIVP